MRVADLPVRPPPGFEPYLIDGASWELYELLLRDTDGQNLRITFDDGRLSLLSPLPIHNRWKTFIGRLIEIMALDLDIPIASLGSTTWKRRDLLKGLEGDETYYVQREKLARCKLDFDLTKDPPPDLAIEVDVTHNPVDRDGVYAALGVTEIWHYDGKSLRAVALRDDAQAKRFEPVEKSPAFPFLNPRELEPFIAMLGEHDEHSIIRSWREHVKNRRQ